MNTEPLNYENWIRAVNITHAKKWQCVKGWLFRSPSGTVHDLSAADLAQLDRIESKGLFVVKS